eukprot:826877_1
MSALFNLLLAVVFVMNIKSKEIKRTSYKHKKGRQRPIFPIPILRLNNITANSGSLIATPSHITTPQPTGTSLIEVYWYNFTDSTTNDWIGIYSPINSSDDEYIDHFGTDGPANGGWKFTVWNMRTNYQMRYFHYDGKNYILAATSNIVTVNPQQPLQGHISLTENSPSEMRIKWVSAKVANPQVKIGIISSKYTDIITADSYTYNTTSMCQSDAGTIGPLYFRDPGFIYDAIVTNLKPNSKYYYIFGSENNWSDEQWFVTGSDPNDIESQGTFKFAMYGDQGITSNSKVTLSRCYGEINSDVPLELLLHIGDLGYAEGRGWVWERWGNMISQVAMHVPYMISIGNHEYDHTYKPMSKSGNDVSGVSGTGYHPSWGNMGDDSYGECGAPSFYRFSAPNNGNSIFWYSFNYRSVHFILLSSEHDYSNGSNGAKWLLNDLENVNKTVTPWIILSIHRPLYVSQDYPSDLVVATHLIDELEPMLYKYNVDLVLTGHFHSYQRT